MTIEYVKQDLLSVKDGVIIHGCNMKATMGAGVAKAIKEKHPQCFNLYKIFLFHTEDVSLGDYCIYQVNGTTVIINLLTQDTYGFDKSKYVSYDAIHKGFSSLHKRFSIEKPFYFPQIGSGLGGGDWKVISSIIESVCPGRKLICCVL